jgi:hypothetical protein
MNVLCFINSIVIKKLLFFKLSMVGQTDSMGGLSPLMPYPGYATTINVNLTKLKGDDWIDHCKTYSTF